MVLLAVHPELHTAAFIGLMTNLDPVSTNCTNGCQTVKPTGEAYKCACELKMEISKFHPGDPKSVLVVLRSTTTEQLQKNCFKKHYMQDSKNPCNPWKIANTHAIPYTPPYQETKKMTSIAES